MPFLDAGNVLTWATFAPLLGTGVILVLVVARHTFSLPARLVDEGSRAVALLTLLAAPAGLRRRLSRSGGSGMAMTLSR